MNTSTLPPEEQTEFGWRSAVKRLLRHRETLPHWSGRGRTTTRTTSGDRRHPSSVRRGGLHPLDEAGIGDGDERLDRRRPHPTVEVSNVVSLDEYRARR